MTAGIRLMLLGVLLIVTIVICTAQELQVEPQITVPDKPLDVENNNGYVDDDNSRSKRTLGLILGGLARHGGHHGSYYPSYYGGYSPYYYGGYGGHHHGYHHHGHHHHHHHGHYY